MVSAMWYKDSHDAHGNCNWGKHCHQAVTKQNPRMIKIFFLQTGLINQAYAFHKYACEYAFLKHLYFLPLSSIIAVRQ
jgi:hypothetical protein